MRRREFIALLGGAAATCSRGAYAQQPAMPTIGYVLNTSRAESQSQIRVAFHQGLPEMGFTDGRNVAIEYRYADGRLERLPSLIVDLVRRQVAVIFAAGGEVPTLIAKGATTSIPIVFLTNVDPVRAGLVASLNRPGGNATGVTMLAGPLGAKRLELLHALVPKAAAVGVLVNPTNPSTEPQLADVQAAARSAGLRVHVLQASNGDEVDKAFATLIALRVGALLVNPDPMFLVRRNQLIALAGRLDVPTLYYAREFVEDGGLISYGASIAGASRQCGNYVGRILKGAKPADLPVLQPTKYETIVNLKTAKAQGIAVPEAIMVAATEVIE